MILVWFKSSLIQTGMWLFVRVTLYKSRYLDIWKTFKQLKHTFIIPTNHEQLYPATTWSLLNIYILIICYCIDWDSILIQKRGQWGVLCVFLTIKTFKIRDCDARIPPPQHVLLNLTSKTQSKNVRPDFIYDLGGVRKPSINGRFNYISGVTSPNISQGNLDLPITVPHYIM